MENIHAMTSFCQEGKLWVKIYLPRYGQWCTMYHQSIYINKINGVIKRSVRVLQSKDLLKYLSSDFWINTIRIKSSENKQLPGASRSGRSQWEEAKLRSATFLRFLINL